MRLKSGRPVQNNSLSMLASSFTGILTTILLTDDELINTPEWSEGFFANRDEDNDSLWNEDEYDAHYAYYETR